MIFPIIKLLNAKPIGTEYYQTRAETFQSANVMSNGAFFCKFFSPLHHDWNTKKYRNQLQFIKQLENVLDSGK